MQDEVLRTMAKICSDYFKHMFSVDFVLSEKESFQKTDRPAFKTDILAYIGLAGEKHQGQLIIGFPKNFPEKLVASYLTNMQDDEKDDFCKSAICELLNNLGGTLSRHELFNRSYPEIAQTLPVLNDTTSEGSVYFMKSDGGSVKFRCMDCDIYVYLSLKDFCSRQIKSEISELI